jgi:hypothetical protein
MLVKLAFLALRLSPPSRPRLYRGIVRQRIILSAAFRGLSSFQDSSQIPAPHGAYLSECSCKGERGNEIKSRDRRVRAHSTLAGSALMKSNETNSHYHFRLPFSFINVAGLVRPCVERCACVCVRVYTRRRRRNARSMCGV